jgi:hypothetical protein
LPASTFWQVPWSSGNAQVWQDGQVPTLQQKPSVQWPEPHSASRPQVAPRPFGDEHVPPLQ